jgi:ElaB/YqjD/DUF883 family membrane-anchored ribosome-binding protein
MNEPTVDEPADVLKTCCAEVRRNPGTALLIAVGAGLAIGLLFRSLQPEQTPRSRLARLLEDLECAMRERAEPALRKAGTLARDGADVLQEGLHRGEARLERFIRDVRQRILKTFS